MKPRHIIPVRQEHPQYGWTNLVKDVNPQELRAIDIDSAKDFGAGFLPFVTIQGSIGIARPLTSDQFMEIIMTFESKRFEVAKTVVRSLLKNIEYSEVYEQFLQETITNEEFKLESEKFAVEPRRLEAEQLHFEAIIALDLAGISTTDADQLSMMLGTDPLETDSIIHGREYSIATA